MISFLDLSTLLEQMLTEIGFENCTEDAIFEEENVKCSMWLKLEPHCTTEVTLYDRGAAAPVAYVTMNFQDDPEYYASHVFEGGHDETRMQIEGIRTVINLL